MVASQAPMYSESENNSADICYEFMQEAGEAVSLEECQNWTTPMRKQAIDWAVDKGIPFSRPPDRPRFLP
jgi:hypothetical protein